MAMPSSPFEEALDAAQEYLALQEALAAALRSGFLSLAQARYSMGADRVSVLQLPTHMTATARLRTDQGRLDLVRVTPRALPSAVSSGAGSRGGEGKNSEAPSKSMSTTSSNLDAERANTAVDAAAQDAAQAAEVRGDSTLHPAAASDPENVAALLQRMQLLAQQSGSLVDELAAKYCGGTGNGSEGTDSAAGAAPPSSAAGDLDSEYEEVAHPSRPLRWFGSLVAPSLREAEGHFCRALELVVQAANAQAALRRGLERQRAVAAGGDKATAAAGGTTS